jgi:hypothetical protein
MRRLILAGALIVASDQSQIGTVFRPYVGQMDLIRMQQRLPHFRRQIDSNFQ